MLINTELSKTSYWAIIKYTVTGFLCIALFSHSISCRCSSKFGVNSKSPGAVGSITQHDIAWTFREEAMSGQFINGDYWVIGPVTLTEISPGWDGEKNGSMINPPAENFHGYDSRSSTYNAAYNVGLPGNLPLTLNPGDSLVSTTGLEESHDLYGRTYLRSATVLTVLETAPPEDAFRPPYVAGSKSIYRFSDIESSLLDSLPSLDPVSSTPDLSDSLQKYQRVWLDHMPIPYSQHIHPVENMQAYGQQVCNDISDGALLLMLHHDNFQQKIQLLIYFLQIGIDQYHVALRNNMLWNGNGGQSSGRKIPIVFAAAMFNDQGMKDLLSRSGDYLYDSGHGAGNVPEDYVYFGEDDQTFYVKDEDVYSTPYEVNVLGGDLFKYGGTVDVTNGSATVYGTGTDFQVDDLMTGERDGRPVRTNFAVVGTDLLTDVSEDWNDPCGMAYEIDSIDVNNQILTLTEPYRGTTQSGMDYRIGTCGSCVGWLWYGHGFSPSTYLKDYEEYTEEHLGLPEWGITHAAGPNSDGYGWDYNSYRRCCTAYAWAGEVLTALIMEPDFGTRTLWNHDALFDYQDRYMAIELAGIDDEGNPFPTGLRQQSDFAEEMWNTYREDYGCVYTGLNTITHEREYDCK